MYCLFERSKLIDRLVSGGGGKIPSKQSIVIFLNQVILLKPKSVDGFGVIAQG
jgi:hypothetical protein